MLYISFASKDGLNVYIYEGDGRDTATTSIIEGNAQVTMDKVTVELGPGDAVLADPGVEHNLVNTGSIPLRILVITGPAKPDDQGTA